MPAMAEKRVRFAALDAITRLRMHDLDRDYAASITHPCCSSPFVEAIALADRIVVMSDGRIGDA
jgi:sulfonate transport system ATP-binding protein